MAAHDWLQTIRAAYVSLDEINPGTPGLYYNERDLDNMMHWVSEEGFNTIFQQSHHFRLCYLDRWDAITARVKEAVDAAHRYGLRYFEHHSSVIVLDQDASAEVNGRPLLDMCVQSARSEGPVFLTWPAYERMLCPNNPHYVEFYLDYLRELVPGTGVDGLMCDDAAFCPDTTVCACPYCREAFRRKHGIELPPVSNDHFWQNLENPDYRAWLRFRQESIGDYHVKVRGFLREVAPAVAYVTCQASPTDTLLNVTWALTDEEVARSTDLLFVEVYDTAMRDHRVMWERVVFEYQVIAAMGREYGQPVLALPYFPQGDESYYALALISALQLMPWMSPDWQSDHMIRFLRDHQDLHAGAHLTANVAVLWSRNTRDFYGSTSNEAYVSQVGACVVALAKGNVPCRVVTETALWEGIGDGCRVLLAPEAACLSDEACRAVGRFVDAGGTLITTPNAFSRDATGAVKDTAGPDGLLTGEPGKTRVGRGGVHLLPDRPTDLPPEAFGELLNLVRDEAGDAMPLRVTGAPPGLFATLARTPDGRHVLHLVNLRWKEDHLAESGQTVSFAFAQDFAGAALRSPEWQGEKQLSLRAGRLEVPICETGRYALVELE
jgi:hypothetical protein